MLLYEIRREDFIEELANDPKQQNNFDFSHYPNDSPLPCDINKLSTLKFKNEIPGKFIREFFGLKLKMYSKAYENQRQKRSITGVY